MSETQEYNTLTKAVLEYFDISDREEMVLRHDSRFMEMVRDSAYDLQFLPYVKYQTPGLCMAAVNNDGFALQFVKEQTPELCMAAVRECGYTLMYVVKQTPELCLAAVKRHWVALKYVKEQTPEICLAACNGSILSAYYIQKNIMEEVLNGHQ